MKRFFPQTQIFLALSVLLLAVLACNLPSSGDQPEQATAISQVEQPQQDQVEQPTTQSASQAPTQALPRPTHQEGQSSLPKPTIPAPPAQTTRQPAAISEQTAPTESSQSNLPQTNTGGEAGDFYIVNNTSSLTICYYYMALSSDPEWGPDRLGEQDVIYPGESYMLTDVPSGIYDAQALDCDGNTLGEVWGFEFPLNDTFTLYE